MTAVTKLSNHRASKEELLNYYEQMLLLRRFEERAAQLYTQGQIAGFCHLYIGQEAVLTGIKAATKPEDDQITSYRCHAHAIACGVEPEAVMAELTGRETGVSKGKGGSMHMFDPEKHFWGGHGIVGAQISLGTGIAFANKYRGDDTICVAYMGDGALHQGQVYESFNMAKLWDLPVLYIIENNEYAMGTSVQRSAGNVELYKRGESFGIPGKQVDGMDILAVKAAVEEAADYIRSGKGPYLLEMKTYRYRGHSMSDPATYRSKEEVQNMKDHRDPIQQVTNMLVEEHAVKEEDLKAIDSEIKKRIKEVAEHATTSALPDEAELYTDIMPK